MIEAGLAVETWTSARVFMWRTRLGHMTKPAAPPAIDVQVTEHIQRKVDVVAEYMADPSRAPEWYANISQVEWETPPPLGVGTKVAFVAHFLGRELRYTYEIVEHTSRSLVMRTAEGPFPMETSYRYDSVSGGGTQVTLRNRGTPSGFPRLVAPFIRLAMRRANNKDLRALKRILEHDQHQG